MLNWLKSLFASKTTILVSIPVAEEFPNQEEMAARNQIIDALDAQGFGKFVGAGGGFSQMDFEYEVADAEQARQQVEKMLAEYLPGREFEISFE